MKKKHSKKLVIWVVVIAALFVALFSEAFIGEYATHECDEAECPICEMVAECTNNLKTLGMAAILLVAVCFVMKETKQMSIVITDAESCNSLFFQKVRLNN